MFIQFGQTASVLVHGIRLKPFFVFPDCAKVNARL